MRLKEVFEKQQEPFGGGKEASYILSRQPLQVLPCIIPSVSYQKVLVSGEVTEAKRG